MGTQARINQITGVNRNAGIGRINRNRIARGMVSRMRGGGGRNVGATM